MESDALVIILSDNEVEVLAEILYVVTEQLTRFIEDVYDKDMLVFADKLRKELDARIDQKQGSGRL